MFVKFLDKGDRVLYIMNVKEIDSGEIQSYSVDALSLDACINIPIGCGSEVYGRRLVVKSMDEASPLVVVFCDNFAYLCNETGQTVDRISCREV